MTLGLPRGYCCVPTPSGAWLSYTQDRTCQEMPTGYGLPSQATLTVPASMSEATQSSPVSLGLARGRSDVACLQTVLPVRVPVPLLICLVSHWLLFPYPIVSHHPIFTVQRPWDGGGGSEAGGGNLQPTIPLPTDGWHSYTRDSSYTCDAGGGTLAQTPQFWRCAGTLACGNLGGRQGSACRTLHRMKLSSQGISKHPALNWQIYSTPIHRAFKALPFSRGPEGISACRSPECHHCPPGPRQSSLPRGALPHPPL